MTMMQALERAMGRTPDPNAVEKLRAAGVAVANQDSMSQAIHDVFCGIMADHQHPNEKDQEQARLLLAALQQRAADELTA